MTKAYDNSLLARNISISGTNTIVSGLLSATSGNFINGITTTGIIFPSGSSMSIASSGYDRFKIDYKGDAFFGGQNVDTLRYVDINNINNSSNAGSILRLITSNVSGTGNASVDLVKYKNGQFTISNADTSPDTFTTFNVGNSERLRITSSGNIGIGTAQPTSKLHVVGDITANSGNFTNSLQVNGTGVSISGHTHTSSNITDFNSSVSGLLPVKDIVAGYDISITNTSGIYSISSTNFIHEDDKQPHGFVDRISNLISMSGNTFTITPTGSSYDIYSLGTRYTKTSGESISLPNTNGTYYIHFNTDTLALDYKTTAFNFDSDVPVAYVYWNTTQGSGIFFADERHGIQMDRSTHRYLHNVFGTQYINGLSISNYILDGDGSLNSHASIAISDGVIYDEDIIINITNSANPSPLSSFEQVLSPTGQFPVYYRSGVGGVWSSTNNSSYPLKFGTTAQYNLNTAGTWTTPNTANSKFVASWLCATNQIHSPVIAIMGQMFSSNITRAESDNAWGSLDLGGLPIVEFRPLYRLIYETSSTYTNAVKSRLISILDLRSQLNTVEGGTSNDHGSLYGLADDDHSQYVHIDTTRTISANHTFSNGLTSNGLISSSSGNFISSLQVNGTGVSISGHTHSSSNITDFNSSVSGLLPVTNILAGSGIEVSSSSGSFTINSTGGSIPINVTNSSNLYLWSNFR